jgi:DNA topoisomerase-1
MTALERLRETGIRRVRAGKGFTYRTSRDRPVAAEQLPRIRKLAIPPAWTDVFVAPSPSAKLQAIGRDGAGRWQYRYHPRFRARQDRQKFRKLIDFADALPRMRRRVAHDIRSRGLGQDKVMACAIRVLSTCFMRPGSDEYARRHRHYGLTTIRRQHVTVKGDLVTFDYPGKSGQRQHAEIRDRSVARIIRRMMELPGRELFKFLADDGAVVDVKREHLNEYIKGVMGPDFTAKDFRTWAGTLICACALARVAENDPQLIADASMRRRKRVRPSKSAVRKKVVEAVKETAAELGNTPAVARNSYIEPSVLSSFEKGEVVEKYFETVEELVEHEKPTLAEPEKALKELLEGGAEPA